jgi:uncharacterized protein (TIGR03118 family)
MASNPSNAALLPRSSGAALALAIGCVLYASPASATSIYIENKLVSDIPGFAASTDPDLVNPWGIVHSATSPWWVADNGTAKSTLYNGAGAKQPLIVAIPGTNAAPTGIVNNPNSASGSFGGARFIFAGEDGKLSAWSGGTSAVTAATSTGSVYKGLAIANNGAADHLYAADLKNGRVDVYDTTFAKVSLAGSFSDPTLPTGYGPFGIQNIGGNIFVTYARQSGGTDELDGAHLGFVDQFDANGNFVRRIASKGSLNAPWGITMSPGNFGKFSNMLLIGNFGDGTINAFDPITGTFMGQLHDASGPLVISGLWGLGFGNGASAGPTNALFFSAGINDEGDGLFGNLQAANVAEPSTLAILASGLLGLLGLGRRKVLARVGKPA